MVEKKKKEGKMEADLSFQSHLCPFLCPQLFAGEPPLFQTSQGTRRYLPLRICPSPQDDILRVTPHCRR